jgi:hypothetical protein
MIASDFDKSIRSSFHFLKECKLLRSAAKLKSHSASDEFRELALTSTTSYRDLYLCGLRNSEYNFLLSDYAYLQFNFTGKQHYRFAYYPNPFVSAKDDARALDESVQGGVISFEEYSSLLSDQPYEVTKPLIRFDLDCGAYVRLMHPAAHFHIGMHGENRWPVCRQLTPRSFALLVAKLYYGTEWAHGVLRHEKDGFENRFDRYLVAEKADSQLLGKDLFHEHEKAQLHFA